MSKEDKMEIILVAAFIAALIFLQVLFAHFVRKMEEKREDVSKETFVEQRDIWSNK